MLTVSMSPQEQLFLELVNRARANPIAEVLRTPAVEFLNQDVEEDRLISPEPKQPLAPHQALIDAMVGHVNDMLQRNYFAHDSPDGTDPSSRARAAGYPTGAGENIAWSGNTSRISRDQEVYLRHAGLFESVGHRVNMMRENWREIGPGISFGTYTQEGQHFQSIMAGTLFGDRGGDFFITGVAISDLVSPNYFYEMGEGISNVTIEATNVTTTEVYTTRTGASGGYSLQVPDGIYNLRAFGSKISRPLTVNSVPVSGVNVKVDFNTRVMNTRSIQGRFFEDNNGNGQRDTGDRVIPNLTAFVDLNLNNRLDPGEPSQDGDSTGLFEFDSLLPGAYVVHAMIPEGYRDRSQGALVVDATSRSIVGVDFALQKIDSLPTANNDLASGLAGEDIVVDVLANDSDTDGTLVASSIRIGSLPQHGEVLVQGDKIVYRPGDGFFGEDSFTYSVNDSAGQRSNVATVSVEVLNDKPWQNPAEHLDVDGDGFVVPRDVLALVLELNSVGAHYLGDLARDSASPYYDVSGDNYLSPVDVLFVVSHLNGVGAPEPAGEPPSNEEQTDGFFAALALCDDDESQDHCGLLEI